MHLDALDQLVKHPGRELTGAGVLSALCDIRSNDEIGMLSKSEM